MVFRNSYYLAMSKVTILCCVASYKLENQLANDKLLLMMTLIIELLVGLILAWTINHLQDFSLLLALYISVISCALVISLICTWTPWPAVLDPGCTYPANHLVPWCNNYINSSLVSEVIKQCTKYFCSVLPAFICYCTVHCCLKRHYKYFSACIWSNVIEQVAVVALLKNRRNAANKPNYAANKPKLMLCF